MTDVFQKGNKRWMEKARQDGLRIRPLLFPVEIQLRQLLSNPWYAQDLQFACGSDIQPSSVR